MKSAESVAPSSRHFVLSYPEDLPISAKKDEIVAAIRTHQIVIVAGETGSGKTTQLPKMCLEAGLGLTGKIGCTQPRRIAALSVSRRIAEELGVKWGHEVGCKIRFSDQTRRDTAVKVMTDGILLAETRGDPLLKSYEAIIIDEAHERSLNIDFLLGYLKRLLTRRPDLKLIITSATIDTDLFSRAFDNAPVFEVSGRLFPVEIRYDPLESDDEVGEISYVEGAVRAVEQVCDESLDGDILVFMPSERDIRDVRDRLSEGVGKALEILPLMGSLSASEQERVFRPSNRRKVIVSTNIAETSLTIPKIRYVIDSGLARMSRYNPRTRTKRLPIEEIAKSSAHQRAGRAGRVQEGVCIRLFSEEDFESRADFTDPEILRANLAEVILRMKALDLGEIIDFPFLNPPDPRAIRSGYTLLQELGALDTNNTLTHIGRELSKLPVDPVIGRMLLQSRREGALSDVLVIAAGLSIQDPRERPAEKREKAEQIHRTFWHPDSDFLTLVNIWSAFRKIQQESKGQGALRRFCKEHFLSYMRMREWNDVYAELAEAMGAKDTSEPETTASIKRFDGRYRAIHRSVLTGLLGQLAFRSDKNLYRAGAGRQLLIAPGSSLRETTRQRDINTRATRPTKRDPSKEQWIVAAEIVETSHLFARTVARIIPTWAEELGKHLLKRTMENPHWSAEKGCVMAQERVSIQGLVLAYRKLPFSRVDPEAARDLFVRTLCVTEDSPLEYPFIRQNRKLCDKVAARLAHSGRLNRYELEESLVQFYLARLPLVSSLRELDLFVREQLPRDPTRLTLTTTDLWGGAEAGLDDAQFPDQLEIGGATVQVHYRYAPGSTRDGVTLAVPLALATRIPSKVLEGAIPGLREHQVLSIIRELPKQYRLQLDNFSEAARIIATDDALQRLPLLEGIAHVLHTRFGISVPFEVLSSIELPQHLKPRIEVTEELTTSKDTHSPRHSREQSNMQPDAPRPEASVRAWESARVSWEQDDVAAWEFGDLPSQIEVARVSGVPVYLYPALVPEEQKVALRLLDDEATARMTSRRGMDLLLRRALSKELQDLAKQARGIEQFKQLITLYTSPEKLKELTFEAAVAQMFAREPTYPLLERDFKNALDRARERMPNLVPSILGWVQNCLHLRRQIIDTKRPYPGMREDLEALLPPDFLTKVPFEQLKHLPRYLKAMLVRAERADNNPAREKQCAKLLEPYLLLVRSKKPGLPDEFRWMVEEFRVSLFAQELGTPYPISAARLDKAYAQKPNASR
jgi:ATP-dependent helicase HrpA